jgi:hypothetical protein
MRFTDKCSILAGAAGQDDVALVTVMNDGLAEERQQHAIPLVYRQGAWMLAGEEKVLPWLAAGIATTYNDSMAFTVVGWAGQVLVVEDQSSRREAIQRNGDSVSIMRSVAAIDNSVYAAGMRRQVYRRPGSDDWMPIDDGVAYHGDELTVGFNAIDGYTEKEIYAVGLGGEVWMQAEGAWHDVGIPTNVHLHAVCCAGNGKVYVGGRSGVLIRGRHDSWEFLDLQTDEPIWAMHWFRNELYLLLGRRIHQGADGKIRRLENDIVGDEDFHSLSSAGGKLWVFGRKKIVQYDGSSWRELDCVLSDDVDDPEMLSFFNDDVLSTGSIYLEEPD